MARAARSVNLWDCGECPDQGGRDDWRQRCRHGFVRACPGRLGYETLHVAHLDDDRTLLKLTALPGTLDRVELPLRPLIAEALALGATALIVAHNHPGGTASPSRADIVATRRLVEVARPLQIELLDHLIFAGKTVVSFRALGLL